MKFIVAVVILKSVLYVIKRFQYYFRDRKQVSKDHLYMGILQDRKPVNVLLVRHQDSDQKSDEAGGIISDEDLQTLIDTYRKQISQIKESAKQKESGSPLSFMSFGFGEMADGLSIDDQSRIEMLEQKINGLKNILEQRTVGAILKDFQDKNPYRMQVHTLKFDLNNNQKIDEQYQTLVQVIDSENIDFVVLETVLYSKGEYLPQNLYRIINAFKEKKVSVPAVIIHSSFYRPQSQSEKTLFHNLDDEVIQVFSGQRSEGISRAFQSLFEKILITKRKTLERSIYQVTPMVNILVVDDGNSAYETITNALQDVDGLSIQFYNPNHSEHAGKNHLLEILKLTITGDVNILVLDHELIVHKDGNSFYMKNILEMLQKFNVYQTKVLANTSHIQSRREDAVLAEQSSINPGLTHSSDQVAAEVFGYNHTLYKFPNHLELYGSTPERQREQIKRIRNILVHRSLYMRILIVGYSERNKKLKERLLTRGH
ncbi:MAG: hypothetical protein KC713_10820, partial [Candidatus Omnitrophica bacterium]|nr:hypothetical protein [Candidatus Omnitrophota bacterium]